MHSAVGTGYSVHVAKRYELQYALSSWGELEHALSCMDEPQPAHGSRLGTR